MPPRTAFAGLPAEVEVLIAEHGGSARSASLRFSTCSGFVVAVGCQPGSALLFHQALGSQRGALPLSKPHETITSKSPPSVVVWPSRRSGTEVGIRVAILSEQGTLRVFDDVDAFLGPDPPQGKSPRYREIRVASALAASVGSDTNEVHGNVAHSLVYVARRGDEDNALIIFGSRGSAASVCVSSEELSASPLLRSFPEEGRPHGRASSASLSTKLFSAIRASWTDSSRDEEDWINSRGAYCVIGASQGGFATGSTFMTRRNGCIEKWNATRMVWSMESAQLASRVCSGAQENMVALAADVSQEEMLVVLFQYHSEGNPRLVLVCLDGSEEEAPSSVALHFDLGPMSCDSSELHMTISCGVVYLFTGSAGNILWTSVAKGIAVGNQVQGQLEISPDTICVSAVDCAYGLAPKDTPAGGMAGFVSANGILSVSICVPAPVSTRGVASNPSLQGMGYFVPAEISCGTDPLAFLWRAYLLYLHGEVNACRATCAAFVAIACGVSTEPSTTTIDGAVLRASACIIDSGEGSGFVDSSPACLLVDSQLDEKVSRHAPFLMFLADSSLIPSGEPVASAVTTSRLWDLLSGSARGTVVANAEKLASAHRLRRVENQSSARCRHRMAVAGSVHDSELSTATTATELVLGLGAPDVDESDQRPGSIIADALVAASGLIAVEPTRDAHGVLAAEESAVLLYRNISMFHLVLPAIRREVEQAMAKANERPMDDVTGDEMSTAHETVFACRDIVLACDGALAIVRAALDTREECQATHSFEISAMEEHGGWSCDSDGSRSVLRMLIYVTLVSAKGARSIETKALQQCAISLTDALLECCRNAHTCNGVRAELPMVSSPASSPTKRRRVEQAKNMLAIERRSALDILLANGLEKACFDLARKHEDFGMMLALRVDSKEFDQFFEESVQEFDRDFAFFAFDWLERQGKFKLLIYGATGVETGLDVDGKSSLRDCTARSRNTRSLLKEYFSKHRRHLSNISWMHDISRKDFSSAATCLSRQATALSVPGKAMSFPNSRLLLSVAKLCAHVAGSGSELAPESHMLGTAASRDRDKAQVMSELLTDIDRRLFLIAAQHRLRASNSGESQDALLDCLTIVRRVIQEAPVASSALADRVTLSLEVIRKSNLSASDAQQLIDYVWSGCIERQGHFWVPLLRDSRQITDDELREQLFGMALFEAATYSKLSRAELNDMINRDVLNVSMVESKGDKERIHRLFQTAVALAEEHAGNVRS